MQSGFMMRWVLNPMMTVFLKTPLHGLVSGNTMLITFTGRKSGKQYTTPVGYIRDGDTVICLTHSRWWKNLEGGAKVSLRIRGRDVQGLAQPVADDVPRIAEGLRKFLVQVPSWARFYDITLDEEGAPKAADLERAAASAILIEIQLQPS
jgi:deazaflavin-dependent oxidoreductase (nitroreductase family)